MTRSDFIIKWGVYTLALVPVWILELYVLKTRRIHAPPAGGGHQISGHELAVFRQKGELELALPHEGKVPLQNGRAAGPGQHAPQLKVRAWWTSTGIWWG